MPIEFRCTQCQRLLRTQDDAAGKQARCPECGTILVVPAPESALPPLGSWPSQEVGSTQSPTAAEAASPYPSGPAYTKGAGFPSAEGDLYAYALGRVAAPATGLIVVGTLGLILNVLGIMLHLVGGLAAAGPRNPDLLVPTGIGVIAGFVASLLAILVVAGGLKMKNLENRGLAMAAAIIALIPCTSPCCLLGVPFGIWALVVLGDPRVRPAFHS